MRRQLTELPRGSLPSRTDEAAAPLPLVMVAVDEPAPPGPLDPDATVVTPRIRAKRRWRLRLCLVALLDVVLLISSGTVHLPHNLGEAHAILRASASNALARLKTR